MINRVSSITFILLICSACAGQQAYKTVYSYAYGAITGNAYQPINKEYFENQKYSFVLAKVGKSDPVRLVLEKKEGALFKWVSAEKTIIFTNKYGRIVKSKGLKNDVNFRIIPGQSNLISKPEILINKNIQFSVDFLYPELFGIRGYDSFISKSPINYEFLEGDYREMTKLSFRSHFPIIQWESDGFIIFDKNNITAISQYIHPHHPRIELYFYYK
jgi:hypothetical protein